jgi:hypothetical protein
MKEFEVTGIEDLKKVFENIKENGFTLSFEYNNFSAEVQEITDEEMKFTNGGSFPFNKLMDSWSAIFYFIAYGGKENVMIHFKLSEEDNEKLYPYGYPESAAIEDFEAVTTPDEQELYEEKEFENMLTYDKLPEKVKDYFRRNITISVAFVKTNGAIRHMAFRRNLKSYVKSDAEKTEKQINKLQNNNLMLVYDTNIYIKELAQLRASGAENPEEKAAKKSFRNFRLNNVLGFLCGGEFFDFREDNQILERYGEETYDALTKNMVKAMHREETEAEMELNSEEGLMEVRKFIREKMLEVLKEQKILD